MQASSQLEPRNRRFDLDDDVPRHWHGGRCSVSLFFDNLSVFFPAGERFFIESVHAYRERLDDPELLRDMRAFCAQEGFHSREHVRYNTLLASRGYPVERLEKRVEALLARVRRRSSRRHRLAITCALEHFTALMAYPVLADPRTMEDAHPVMAALWRWHAAEEQEHKAVAFDVFHAAGGTYAERVAALAGATVVFWAKVLEQQIALMRVDGIAASPREWFDLVYFLFVEPGLCAASYGVTRTFRPGFHPNDLDAAHVVAAWRAAQ